MTAARPQGANVPAWIAVFLSIALPVAGFIYNNATVNGQVTRNSTDILELKADNRGSNQLLREIDRRTSRIEAKLEILLPTAGIRPEGDSR